MSSIPKPLILSAACLLLVACGEDEDPPPPEPVVSELAVACTSADGVGPDEQELDHVSAMVTDPNRDLVEVRGRINGTSFTLTDDDADEIFTGSPPKSEDEPWACGGEFFVSITATDQAGNVTTVDEAIAP